MDGILPLYKPRGMTSHDCVMKVRRLYQTKKVGHTGTLDPDAEGVLTLCLNQATKLVPYMTDSEKAYEATIMIGTSTETEDASGRVVSRQTVTKMPDQDEIKSVLQSLIGEMVQIPPMYSAVRVNGKRLYEYARANATVERPVRYVNIQSLELASVQQLNNQMFKVRIVCSKGTYIRTLCVDIGSKLGFSAHMADLVRLKTGGFSVEETYTFDDIEKAVNDNAGEALLVNMSRGIGNMDWIKVDEATRKRVLQGQKLPEPKTSLATNPFGVLCNTELLAIYEYHPSKDGEIKPVRVFN